MCVCVYVCKRASSCTCRLVDDVMAFKKIPCRSNYISIYHFSKIQRVLFDAAGTYKSELGREEKKPFFFFLQKAVKSRKEKKGPGREREREREREMGASRNRGRFVDLEILL